jgi:hypothetical protein
VKTAQGAAMPRSTCWPSGTSEVVVAAAAAPETAEGSAQPLQPAYQVDGGADGSEV